MGTPIEPAAYLFDMDGLLLDTERLFLRSFVTLTETMGIVSTDAEAFFATLVGSSSKHTTAQLHAFLPAGTDIDGFDQEWRDLHAQNVKKGIPLKPYVGEVLQAIRHRNKPMAVVTSTHGAAARHHLEQAGLIGYFETVCAGDEVAANKPDPTPYLTGAERLGVMAPKCVAFEDSDLGTTAAARAGCLTVQIPDLRPQDFPIPDLGQIIAQDLRHGAVQIGLFDGALT